MDGSFARNGENLIGFSNSEGNRLVHVAAAPQATEKIWCGCCWACGPATTTPTTNSSLLGGNEGSVPATTIFDDTALCGIVDIDQPKALLVSLGPLKIVQEGPDNVTLDRHPLAHNLGNGLYVRAQIVYTPQVVNVVVAIPLIVEGGTTFRDNESFGSVLAVNARQDVGESVGEDLPAY